jgi:hypothetical protein
MNKLTLLLSLTCAIGAASFFDKAYAQLTVKEPTAEEVREMQKEAARLSTGKASHAKAGKDAEKGKSSWVRATIEIKAPREVVWEAVHEERKHDPDLAYSKVIVPGEHEYTLEQKMVLIPVIGSAVCQMHNKEVPNERIDYKLIKSDRFKHLEGSWVLSTAANGNTNLELLTNIDLGLPVPRSMVNNLTQKKLQRRLKNVKEAAEVLNNKIVHAKKTLAH